MLDQLPADLVLKITQELGVKDILSIRDTNKSLRSTIDNISKYIVTSELQKQNLSKQVLINLETYIGQLIDNYNLKNPKSRNWLYFDGIYRNVLIHYITYRTLSNFPNQLTVYIIFILCQIEWCDPTLKNQHYNFLKQFEMQNTNSCEPRCNFHSFGNLWSIRYRYYSQLLYKHCHHTNWSNLNFLPMTMLHDISKHIVTVSGLCKLFGSKRLVLERTQLVHCCELCYNFDLTNIVLYKFNRPNDYFLSQNYNEIKRFFEKHCPEKYHLLCQYELVLVNRMITYVNPFNNKRMRLGTRVSNKFMYSLLYETHHSYTHRKVYENLHRYIYSKQAELVYKLFS